MLMKVTLLALLGGVAVAEVSNYEPVHSPYTSSNYEPVHSPYTSKNDLVQHYFGARQDGILDYGPYLASVGMVSPLIYLIYFNTRGKPGLCPGKTFFLVKVEKCKYLLKIINEKYLLLLNGHFSLILK